MVQHQHQDNELPSTLRTLLRHGQWLQQPDTSAERERLVHLILSARWSADIPGFATGAAGRAWQALLPDGRRWLCRVVNLSPVDHEVPEKFLRTTRALTSLSAHNIPVLTPIALLTNAEQTALLQSVPAATDSLSDILSRQAPTTAAVERSLDSAASVLARLHRLEPVDCPTIPAVPKGFTFINAHVQQHARFLGQLRADSAEHELLLWLVRWLEHEKLPCPEVAVVHGDYQPAHLLVDRSDNTLAAVVHWDNVQTGDVTFDVAWFWLLLRLRWGEDLAHSFVQAYDRHGTLDPDRLEYYRVFALARRYREVVRSNNQCLRREVQTLVQVLKETAFWRD